MPPVEAERIRAILRMLLDTGDITPQGVRMVDKVLAEVSW